MPVKKTKREKSDKQAGKKKSVKKSRKASHKDSDKKIEKDIKLKQSFDNLKNLIDKIAKENEPRSEKQEENIEN